MLKIIAKIFNYVLSKIIPFYKHAPNTYFFLYFTLGCEFRITIDPNGRQIESPTVHCAPDLTRTPKKSTKKRYIVLRAPSAELKAVWQNLLTRQM